LFVQDLFRKSVPTPDQVRGKLFRDHARAATLPRNQVETGTVFACQNRPRKARIKAWVRSGVYFLLCMFKGFAFARPLCGRIKVNLTGLGLR
jgi:hypothetical protein